jgi:hypothetical protein
MRKAARGVRAYRIVQINAKKQQDVIDRRISALPLHLHDGGDGQHIRVDHKRLVCETMKDAAVSSNAKASPTV